MYKLVSGKVSILLLIYFVLLLISNIFEILGLSSILIFLNFILDIENPIFSDYTHFLDQFNNQLFQTENIKFYVYLIVSFYILKNIISSINIFIKENITIIIGNEISFEVFNNYISKSLMFHEENSLYKLYRNVMSETRKVGLYFLNILQILNDLLIITVIIFFIYIANKDLFFITSILLFPSVILYYFLTASEIKIKSKSLLKLRYSVIKVVVDTFSLIKEVKFNNFQLPLKSKFIKVLKEYQISQIFIQTIKKLPRNFYEIIILICLLFVILYLVNNDYNEKYILSFLSILVVSFLRIMPSATSLSISLSDLKENKVSYDFLKKEISQKVQENHLIQIKKINEILVKNLNFSFKKLKIFNNVNFNIKNFKIIGIKGESGSGKSTFVKILSNIFNTNHANILFNNKFKYKKNNYLNLGYLDNKPYLFNGSVEDNILFFSKKDKLKLNKILSIVSLSRDFLKKIAKVDDQEKVSTGQKQRIALARCLYKSPSLVILDETLSNIDFINSNKILKNLKKNNISVILVSHNHKILNQCDKVFEVKNKKIFKVR